MIHLSCGLLYAQIINEVLIMNSFPNLFKPLKVNEKYTYKNRIESAPMAFGYIAAVEIGK